MDELDEELVDELVDDDESENDEEDLRSIVRSELFIAANIGEIDRFKRFALNLAEAEGTGIKEAIEKLVSESGGRCLHAAAQGGSLNVCKYLLETLKLDHLDSKDDKGHTPLCRAIGKGHLETVRYLIEMGADVDASNDANHAPLHFASVIGDTKIITLLLSRGVHVDVASGSGTALQVAASGGHQDAVKVLLDYGANPNVCSEDMVTPLHDAICVDSWESVALLLQAGADPNAVSYGGHTPLTLAAQGGKVDGIRRLLEAGADPNYIMNLGMTALELAAYDCDYQIVEVLLPVTSRIPTYPDWSVTGLMRHVRSEANKMQREVYMKEKFHQAKLKGRDAFQEEQYLMAANWFNEALGLSEEDPAVLSNLSACYARLGDGINALEYAAKCLCERPEWPKGYYRLGVALNILKRYGDAADAFNQGLKLVPGNKELEDAYMKAIESRLNSIKVEEDNAE